MVLQYDACCHFDEFVWAVEPLENVSTEMLNVDIMLRSGQGYMRYVHRRIPSVPCPGPFLIMTVIIDLGVAEARSDLE
jgi:hypothetical protein